jgi:hypothetical protein
MKKLVVPKFATDSAEAKWWDDQKGCSGNARRLMREARESKRNGSLPSST